MHKKNLVNIAIVFALLLGLISPVIFMGYSEIAQAERAWQEKDYENAARSYSRAAKFLFWKDDLWEKAGISAGLDGNFKVAITDIERSSYHSEQGWLVLSFAYVQTGDSARALAAYQNGLVNYPKSASLYSGLAALYRAQKDWLSEMHALQNQILFDERNAYAHYRLGLLLSFLDPERSLAELITASSLNPELDSVLQTMRTALNISATQTDGSQQLVTIGRSLGLVQDWELALAAFQKSIQLDAENAEAWAWMGEAEQQTGQDGSAALDQAVALDSESVTVRALRGLHWSRIGEYDRMLAEYSLAARMEPENPAWQAAMGDANVKIGDLAAAISKYQRAVELAPDEPTYWRLLAVLCAENGVALEEVGLPAAQKAVELAPKDAFALDALGFTYYSSGRYSNAEETLKLAIEISPQFYSAHIHLAMNYLVQGNKTDAFNSLAFVRDSDPDGIDGERANQLLAKYFP